MVFSFTRNEKGNQTRKGAEMITKYINASILTTELKYIAHGVNCQNKMGSGVAKVLYEAYPDIKIYYHSFNTAINNPERLLGLASYAGSVYGGEDRIVFFNLYTQFHYGYDGKRYVNYAAAVSCFKSLLEQIPHGSKLAIPKIGCGLAGGNWNFMEQLINDTVGDKLEIWVYDINKTSKRNDIA